MMSVAAAWVTLAVTFMLILNDAGTAGIEYPLVEIKGGGPKGELIVQKTTNRPENICMRVHSNAIAIVVCRQLGWNTTLAHLISTGLYPRHQYQTREIALEDVYCTGNESSLRDCEYKETGLNCKDAITVGVDCTLDLTVKLVNGTNNGFGLLTVDVNGMKGLVCPMGITNDVAVVVCRELGWNDTSMAHVRSWPYKKTKLPLAMYHVLCTGNERRLGDCSFITFGRCYDRSRLEVHCSHVTAAIEGGGRKGKLIATVNGRSANVCINRANHATAVVVCRELGWNTTVPLITRISSKTPGSSYSIRCEGHEEKLAECAFNDTIPSCSNKVLVGIDCSAEPRNVKVAFWKTGSRGGLKVKLNGQTGLICRDKATDAVAAVICRELGWNTTKARMITNELTYLSYPYLLFNVFCTGNEGKLADCTYNAHGKCDSFNHLAIDCTPDPTITASIQMIEPYWIRPLVLTFSNGQSAVICPDNHFRVNPRTAGIACQAVGLKRDEDSQLKPVEHATNISLKVTDLYCKGSEMRLEDCTFSVGNDCPWEKYYSLRCRSVKTTTFEIEGGGPKGRLLATVDGQKGTVCYKRKPGEEYFNHNGAKVACRQLGWNTPQARLKQVRTPTNLSNVYTYSSCYGDEVNLGYCFHWNCEHKEHIEIDCSHVPTAAIEGGGSKGRLTVTVAGQTGRVCSKEGHEALAAVVCRELGWNTSRIRKVAMSPTLPLLVDDVYCIGNESKLADCKFITWNECQDLWDFEVDCAPEPVSVKIEGGGHKGRLIATVNGKTGTVCRHGATKGLAKVVCKELGWGIDTARIVTVWAPSTLPIVMDDVRCTGDESRLADCEFFTVNICSHIDDVGIECSPAAVDPCEKNPCQNGGSCVKDGASNFHCLCPPGASGSTCQVRERACSLSYYNQLTTFGGETAFISVPCVYDLVSMQCGRFTVKVEGRSRARCLKQNCTNKSETHDIFSVSINITSDEVTWEGKLTFRTFKLKHIVVGNASFVSLAHNRSEKKIALVTSDNVLSLTLSRDDGFKLLCGNMTSSAEYPTSLCGAGNSGSVTISDRTKGLNLTHTSTTLAYDIFTNRNVEQTDSCKNTRATLEACHDQVEAIRKCPNCFPDAHRTRMGCLRYCLRNKGRCETSP